MFDGSGDEFQGTSKEAVNLPHTSVPVRCCVDRADEHNAMRASTKRQLNVVRRSSGVFVVWVVIGKCCNEWTTGDRLTDLVRSSPSV